ncbi:ATP-binding protein [Wenxinia marina]|uniref:histidine kinase n=1 Tax=Wenxinia marina DSM 24838 TaxID=1123501 RepID=A0A0D0PCS0_9RHOB|nr:ATP-binding protein [Wenxinia marina]KIQ69186.1 Signal transduction histidine kinase [Wenxinia marina DSM 24838]GGL71025.1 hypothetical protein GCM10011392_26960 [Wenxinia marina]
MPNAILRKRAIETLIGTTLAVLLTLAVVAGAFKLSSSLHEDRLSDLRLQGTLELVELREKIEADVHTTLSSLRQIGTALQIDPDMSQAEYSDLAFSIAGKNSAIINLAAATDFRLSLVYPYEENSSILGFDLRDYPDQLAGVTQAVEAGDMIVAGPLDLVQGGVGSIARYPVFVPGDEGDDRLWGIASLVFDHSGLIAAAIGNSIGSDYRLLVTSDGLRDADRRTLFGDIDVRSAADPIELDFDFSGGDWTFLAVPENGWPSNAISHPHNIAIAVLAALAIVAIWLIQIIMRSRNRAEVQLLRAVEAIDGGFAMFDAGGRLLSFNAAYARMYDRCRDAIRRGARFEDILRTGLANGQYPDAVGREEEWLKDRLELHAHPRGEFDQRLSNGRWVRISERRSEDGVLVSIRVDVTELKEAQAAAEEANRAKTDFLSVLSHELRTPLSVITGFVRLVGMEGAMPESRRLASALAETPDVPLPVRSAIEARESSIAQTMRTVLRSAEHLLFLVEEMLDFGQVEAGKLTVRPSNCDVAALIAAATDQCGEKARRKGILLETENADAWVVADPKRTHQILLNLIGNAIKFTEAGSVRISVEAGDEAVEIAVSDSGPGIAVSELGKIFEPFYQVDSSSVRRAGGTGLGLAIARNLAELQGGSLTVSSTEGIGSRFALLLPRSHDEPMRLAGE